MASNPQRVALVTGAAKRIGAATTRLLHARGYRVLVHCHRSRDAAETLVASLNAERPDSATLLAADLAGSDCAEVLIPAAQARWQRLDLLVNNASVFDPTPVASIDAEAWDRIQAINVRAPYFLALGAAPHLRQHGGSVVNIGDVQGERPRAGYSAYCTSKTALIGMTRALAVDLAPGVRVNCVSPGAIIWAETEQDDVRRSTVAGTPLRRTGHPDDIAQAVAFVADAAFVTGHTINVDGGRVVPIG